MIFALIGNQNCGKTTLFNQMTGSNQHVGNFPGVTVEQKMGKFVTSSADGMVVDLPGIYSLRPYTNEEIVTRDFLLKEKPDGIINIIDATNIERNLYLTLQLIELHIPMVLALNMMDEVRNNGGSVNVKEMSHSLGIPVIPISAIRNEGVDDLVRKALEVAENKEYPKIYDFCEPGPVHRCIHGIYHQVEDHAARAGMNGRFASVKLIEGDQDIISRLKLSENELEMMEHSITEMETDRGLDRNAAIADMRYTFIEKVCEKSVVKCQESKEYLRSVRIDSILTNKYLGIPVFAGIMLFIFWMTFGPFGSFLCDGLSAGIDWLSGKTQMFLTNYGINPVVESLVIDGIFTGVGSVVSFLPIILVLFFFLSILEDSGYMARIAFVMDTLLRKIGLSGRSFVPMLLGFGCSVPAVMSSRTLSSKRDRNMTIMLIPFISCSAKIPIYTVFTAAFFPGHGILVMSCLYFGGIITGILMALIFKKILFTGKPMPFVMELPNYRFPSMKSVLILMWEKARDFLEKAFTIIFLASMIIWFLQTFDSRLNVVTDSADSLLAMLGHLIAPIFGPLGFNDWRISTALVTGITAKEAVVSTLGVLTETSVSHVAGALGSMFTVRSALSFLTFTLLYTPCVAAIAAIRREMNSGVKTAGIVVMQCAVAWIAAFAVYTVAGIFLM
ncbi:MAG: ferrous iron transport protein B [Eubacterium sp.]|nr:ferrous iron transport protein B [Eubacterium sp.]